MWQSDSWQTDSWQSDSWPRGSAKGIAKGDAKGSAKGIAKGSEAREDGNSGGQASTGGRPAAPAVPAVPAVPMSQQEAWRQGYREGYGDGQKDRDCSPPEGPQKTKSHKKAKSEWQTEFDAAFPPADERKSKVFYVKTEGTWKAYPEPIQEQLRDMGNDSQPTQYDMGMGKKGWSYTLNFYKNEEDKVAAQTEFGVELGVDSVVGFQQSDTTGTQRPIKMVNGAAD
jgi:hypothetical protein